MTKPIPDKAEVAPEYPDKLYLGTFPSSSRFDTHLDEAGVALTLDKTGNGAERKSVHMHFHYALFAEILRDLAKTVSLMPLEDAKPREALRTAAQALYRALCADTKQGGRETGSESSDKDDISELTPEEEVLLLHCLE